MLYVYYIRLLNRKRTFIFKLINTYFDKDVVIYNTHWPQATVNENGNYSI